jgi:hypothetical protein
MIKETQKMVGLKKANKNIPNKEMDGQLLDLEQIQTPIMLKVRNNGQKWFSTKQVITLRIKR